MDSTTTLGEEEDSTVGVVDASKVEDALVSLVGLAEKELRGPAAETSQPGVKLDYRISAEVTLSLNADWVVFDGFTLKNTELSAKLKTASDRNGKSIYWPKPLVPC